MAQKYGVNVSGSRKSGGNLATMAEEKAGLGGKSSVNTKQLYQWLSGVANLVVAWRKAERRNVKAESLAKMASAHLLQLISVRISVAMPVAKINKWL
jgi:hypothetical protein